MRLVHLKIYILIISIINEILKRAFFNSCLIKSKSNSSFLPFLFLYFKIGSFLWLTNSLRTQVLTLTEYHVWSNEKFESILDLIEDLIDRVESVDLDTLALAVIVLNDGHCLVSEGRKTLSQRLDIVIISATGLASLDNPLNHGLFIGIHKQHEGHLDWVAHDASPPIEVILIAGEPVDQESLLCPPVLLHALLQKLAGDLDWDNLSLYDALVYQSCGLWSWVTLKRRRVHLELVIEMINYLPPL